MNHPISAGIAKRQYDNETSCERPLRDVSEVEREAARMNESMGMLDKTLEELRDRLRPVLIMEGPSEAKQPASCGETAPGSDVGQLLRNTSDHAASMRRQIDTIISRLAL